MSIAIICLTALFASLLTFFSGFGLGTILTPVFAIFFPVEIAISLTAIVHLLNNIFKLFLVGISKELTILFRFGVPSVMASFIGAWQLRNLTNVQTVFNFQIGSMYFETTLLKLGMASLIIVFTLFEIIPRLAKIQFDKKYLEIGGFVSGFFGGLSGNQGALRSMFLIKAGLSKENFISTGVLIACMVDLARLPVYTSRYFGKGIWENKELLIAATLSAFMGAFLGNKFLKKITFPVLQIFVSAALIIVAIAIGLGAI